MTINRLRIAVLSILCIPLVSATVRSAEQDAASLPPDRERQPPFTPLRSLQRHPQAPHPKSKFLAVIPSSNLWPNRLIGDAGLPPEKRRTRTNVTSFKKDTPLLPSGLLGPVRILTIEK